MEKAMGKRLAEVAKAAARTPFHGFCEGEGSNLEPLVRPFPGRTPEEADRLWCAAFVYYCCREAGFEIPIRPKECKTCHLAGCIAWEEFAKGDPRVGYYRGGDGFVPEAGDIVLYDRVFENREQIISGSLLKSGKIRSSPRREMLTTGRGSSNARPTGIFARISGSRTDSGTKRNDKSRAAGKETDHLTTGGRGT